MNLHEKPEDRDQEQEEPQIFRIGEIGSSKPSTRREFVKSTLKVVGAATLLSHVTACEESELGINMGPGGTWCTCHVVDMKAECTCESVCTCHSVSTCVCNMVCTCNTVGGVVSDNTRDCPTYCACVGNCTCDSQGSSSHYWYPC